ncbi:MAG: hypothetical protein ACRC92_00740 [Peptostreptococcaceae bacterium]
MGCCRQNNNGAKKSCCCNQNKAIDKEEYEELKEYLQEEIKEFNVLDYMDENNEHKILVEVEFEEYILELDDINTKEVTLDMVIDSIIRNHMR